MKDEESSTRSLLFHLSSLILHPSFMLVTTLHETTFDYARPIERTFTEARLWPVSDSSQTCHEFSLSVDPMRPLLENRDYYGNISMSFNILPPHRRVVVTGRSVVETHRDPFVPQLVDDFETHLAQMDFLGFDGPIEYSNDVETLRDEAGLMTAHRDAPWFEDESVFTHVQKLNLMIHEQFTYCTDATDVHTHIAEVFEGRRGVCQDFAHVFIAVCRAAQIPCRYVSGYLVTRRARSLAGSGASHAWVEVLLPGHGWCAFDPTNNLLANDSYIKLAHGRDYRDVTPTRGVFKGNGVECRMSVRVHTLTEEDTSSTRNEPELVG